MGGELRTSLFTAARCHRLQTVDSTNNYLRKLAQSGADPGTWVIAHEQTGGRGRYNRIWISPKGNGIYASFLGTLQDSELLAYITQWLGVVVSEAIQSVTHYPISLKWPNDLLCNNKKVGGLLVESFKVENQLLVILGIGINCSGAIPELPDRLLYPASSLSIETGNPITPWKLLPTLVRTLNNSWNLLKQEHVSLIKQRWRSILTIPSGPVRVLMVDLLPIDGYIHAIRDDGSIDVRMSNGTHFMVYVGDIVERGEEKR